MADNDRKRPEIGPSMAEVGRKMSWKMAEKDLQIARKWPKPEEFVSGWRSPPPRLPRPPASSPDLSGL
jgi:hypothetical protein